MNFLQNYIDWKYSIASWWAHHPVAFVFVLIAVAVGSIWLDKLKSKL